MKNSALTNSSSMCWLKAGHLAQTGCLDSIHSEQSKKGKNDNCFSVAPSVSRQGSGMSLYCFLQKGNFTFTERKFCMEAGRELLHASFRFAMTGDYDCGRCH